MPEHTKKIDILNRDNFIDTIVGLIESTAKSKYNRTIAIDGEWGSGKTWVLEEIEEKLNKREKSEEYNPFLVIHYNSWEYDYYQEPIIAIVSALLNSIDKTKKLPSKTKGAIKKGLKQIGEKMLSIGSALVKPYIGIDIEGTVNGVKKLVEISEKDAREKFKFDNFYDFKEILYELKKEILKLSKKYTVVFCVDELDRCLPEYAIKVLERLHHVFDEIENFQILLSIDKSQLENTIKTIFGESVNVSGYLTKFIDVTVTLPIGNLDQEKFDDLFSDYVKNFQHKDSFVNIQCTQDLLNNIFANTNIRRRIKIIEKAKLVHSLMETKVSLSLDYMAVEILLVMISFIFGDLNVHFRKADKFEDIIDVKDKKQKELWFIHDMVFNDSPTNGYARYLSPNEKRSFHLFNIADTWGRLYVILLKQYSTVNIEYQMDAAGDYYDKHYVKQIISYATKFTDILKLIS